MTRDGSDAAVAAVVQSSPTGATAGQPTKKRSRLHPAEKLAQPAVALRLAELEHRCGNLMMVALSIVRSAMREADCVEEGVATIERRLQNLHAANLLLSRRDGRRAAMAETCIEALMPFRDPGAHLHVEGDDLELPEKLVVALSLAIHELATNAAKYGALSIPSGRVLLTWQVSRSDQEVRVSMNWCERDGPVAELPRRSGFGSVLIDRMLGVHLAAPIERSWSPRGLDCAIALRFDDHNVVKA